MSYKQISPIPTSEGGTGDATFTNHALIVGSGAGILNTVPVGSSGTVLIGNTGLDPSFSATPIVNAITISSAPVSATDGANKGYVDSIASGFNFHQTCICASTGNYTVIYNNGASGVGATLTNAGTLAPFTADGYSPIVGDAILIKDQTIQSQNGIYILNVVGSGAVPWVMTRSTSYDNNIQIAPGDVVPVLFGTTQSNTLWIQTDVVVTVGTDPIVFISFLAGAIALINGNSGSVAGNAINIIGGNNIFTSGTSTTLTVSVNGTTQYNLQVGNATGSLSSIAPSSTVGEPLISQGIAANPVFGTASVAGGGTGATTLMGVVIGNGTTPLTANPVTNHNVLVGGVTNAITSVAPTATTGIALVSQGASSDPAFGTTVVAGGGTGSVSFATNGVIISDTTGIGALSALSLSSGQVVIGGTGTPAAATLSAGPGIAISNGNNSITISTTSAGFTWTEVTSGASALLVENGYVINRGTLSTLTLPTSANLGDTIKVINKGVGGWIITYSAGQSIQLGDVQTTPTSGDLASTNIGDSVELVCTTASGTAPLFTVNSCIGNIVVS